MKRLGKRTIRHALRPEILEPRALRASGISSATSVIQDLGLISRSAAVRGVEAVASIESGHSVIFQFSAGAAGDYALRVRHTGEGLTIEARTPAGSAMIDPGPAGPFQTLILPIAEAQYQIEASAAGDDPVFVDWELLLISGVGQAPALSSSVGVSGIAVPLPATASFVVSPPPAPSTSTEPASLAADRIGGVMMGRPVVESPIGAVGPTTPEGSIAMAFNGEGLLPGIVDVGPAGQPPGEASTSVLASTMFPADHAIATVDEALLAIEPWWSQLVVTFLPPGPGDGTIGSPPIEPTVSIDLEPQATGGHALDPPALEPAFAMGLVTSIVIARRRIRGTAVQNGKKSSNWLFEEKGWIR